MCFHWKNKTEFCNYIKEPAIEFGGFFFYEKPGNSFISTSVDFLFSNPKQYFPLVMIKYFAGIEI